MTLRPCMPPGYAISTSGESPIMAYSAFCNASLNPLFFGSARSVGFSLALLRILGSGPPSIRRSAMDEANSEGGDGMV